MIKIITKRLQAVLDLIEDDTVCDIGTDHAYVPIRLCEENRIKKAIACDKNKGPIEIAESNVIQYGFSDIIELRQGDGLQPVNIGEVKCCVIAGMGGNLIADIIEADFEKAKTLKMILQPMNAQYELRKRLESMGFGIVKEELATEGFKVYNILVAKYGNTSENKREIEYHIPESLFNHDKIDALINKKKREFIKIYEGLNSSAKKTDNDIFSANYAKEMLSEIARIEQECIKKSIINRFRQNNI